MNRPPTEYVRVDASVLQRFVADALGIAGVRANNAEFLARMLVLNDLRGVFSHGTRQAAHYVPDILAGRLNPNPQPGTVTETPATLVVDGDGGLGYYAAQEAALALAEKAAAVGVAAAVARHHGHIGAAGLYARVPLERGLFCYVTSGHQLDLRPGRSVMTAAGGSPMAFAVPAGDEPPLVLDFGATNGLEPSAQHFPQLVDLAPGPVFRCLGLGTVCQALGGLLAGVPVDAERAERRWPGANQGTFMIAIDLALFGPFDAFRREMDAYARRVRELAPLTDRDPAALPGALEWERERENAERGIPVRPEHAEALLRVAQAAGIPAPV